MHTHNARTQRAANRSATALIAALPLLIAGALTQNVRAQCLQGVWINTVGSPGVSHPQGAAVNGIVGLPSGSLLVGGLFNSAGGRPLSNIAVYETRINMWYNIATFDGPIYTMVPLPNGDIILGGDFNSIGTTTGFERIARYNPTTGAWSGFGRGMNGPVRAIVGMPNGDIIFGGDFTTAGSTTTTGLVQYRPSTGRWFQVGAGVNGQVYALAAGPGGDVIVGGSFTLADGVPLSNIAKFSFQLGLWSSLGGGVNAPVRAMTTLPGGDVVVGGSFTSAGGQAVSRIARLNPATGAWSALTGAPNGPVTALALRGQDSIIVGGTFSVAGTRSADNIAEYELASGTWRSLRSGIGASPTTLYLDANGGGDLFVGGTFSTANADPAGRIARYNFGTLPPKVLAPPAPLMVVAGSSAAMTTIADIPSELTYLWCRNGVPLSAAANPTAATAVLVLTGVQAAQAGSYDCVVTNACGVATSTQSAMLVVVEPNGGSCSLADVAGGGPDGDQPDGIIDGNDFVAFINAFAAGC